MILVSFKLSSVWLFTISDFTNGPQAKVNTQTNSADDNGDGTNDDENYCNHKVSLSKVLVLSSVQPMAKLIIPLNSFGFIVGCQQFKGIHHSYQCSSIGKE